MAIFTMLLKPYRDLACEMEAALPPFTWMRLIPLFKKCDHHLKLHYTEIQTVPLELRLSISENEG